MDEPVEGLTDDLGRLVPQDTFDDRTYIGETALGVQGEDDFVYVLNKRPVLLFGSSEGLLCELAFGDT